MREYFYLSSKLLLPALMLLSLAHIKAQLQFDASISSPYVNQYTEVPMAQTPLGIVPTASNVGTSTITGVVITTSITDGISFFSQSSNPMTLAPGQTFQFPWPGGFDVPNPGTWVFQHSVTLNETDGNMGNNSVVNSQLITEQVYARDNRTPINAIGWNPGFGGGGWGNQFTVNQKAILLGGQVDLGFPGFGGGPQAGSQYEISLYEFNGTPGALITQSTFTVPAANYQTNLQILFDIPILVDPGDYILALDQDNADPPIYVVLTAQIYNANTHWNHLAGAWQTMGQLGFPNVPAVRMLFDTSCMYATAGDDREICIDDATVLGGNPTVDIGFAPYTYQWSPSTFLDDPTISNPTATPTQTITYTLIATDSAGCAVSREVTITVNPKDTAAVFIHDTDFCIDDSPVHVDIQPQGGVLSGPGVYLDSVQEILIDSVCEYTIIVSGSGFLDETSFTFTDGLNNVIANGGPFAFGSTNTITVNSLEAPHTFFLETQGFFNDNAASYSVSYGGNILVSGSIGGGQTVTEGDIDGGCVGKEEFYVFDPSQAGVGTHEILYCYTNDFNCTFCDTFIVTVHDLPNVVIDPALPVCFNDSVNLTANLPFGTWSGPGIVDGQSGLFSGSAAGAGIHMVYYELVDANGCYNIDSAMIRVWSIPIADAGRDVTICSGETVIIGGSPTGTPGNEPNGFIDNYQWTPQSDLSSSVDPNPVASPTQTTTYVVAVQDNNGCIDRDTMTVFVQPSPVADAGPDVSTCSGTPVIIGGSPSASMGTAPYNYIWTPAAGLNDASAPNPMANPAGTTTYTLTVIDENGCESSDVVTVTVNQGPVADAGLNVETCSGTTITIGGSPTAAGGVPPYTYSWSPATGLSNTNTANPTFTSTNMTATNVPFTFYVTVTDAFGCTSMDQVTITVYPGVIVDAGVDDEICFGLSTQIGGLAPATNGIPPYSYNWGPSVGLITPNVPNPTVTPTSSTIYTLTVTDFRGCEGSDEVVVIVNPLPIVEAGPDQTICRGTLTTIGGLPTANGGLAPYTYEWTPYIGLSDPTVPNPQASPLMTTTYTLVVTDAKGCEDLDVVTVFVVEGPRADAGVDKEICFGETISIGSNPAGSGGTMPYQYVWTPGSSLSSNVAENPMASPQMTTTYILTVYDANNCMDVDSMVVTVHPLPIPEILGLDNQYCIYEGIIELTGNPSGGVFSGPGIAGSTFIVDLAGPGTHVINYTVVDQNGCKGEVNVVVNVDRMPIIWAGPDKFVYLGEDTKLDATADGNYTYTWTPDTYLSDQTVLNPDVIKPLQTTTYTLLAVDDNGCEATDEVTVFVDVNTPIQIMVPNIFSPNGDGINDTWIIPILDFFPDNNVKVFNRWGMLVFEADNYSNGDAWDGGDLPAGAYYYIIQLSLQGDKVYKGHINIVR